MLITTREFFWFITKPEAKKLWTDTRKELLMITIIGKQASKERNLFVVDDSCMQKCKNCAKRKWGFEAFLFFSGGMVKEQQPNSLEQMHEQALECPEQLLSCPSSCLLL